MKEYYKKIGMNVDKFFRHFFLSNLRIEKLLIQFHITSLLCYSSSVRDFDLYLISQYLFKEVHDKPKAQNLNDLKKVKKVIFTGSIGNRNV